MNARDSARWDAVVDTVRAALRTELRLGDDEVLPEEAEIDLLPGADSIRIMRTVSTLERLHEVEFDDDALRSAETVADLARLVIEARSETPARS